MSDIKRQIAYKCSIKHLQEAEYVQQQGVNPNYLNLNNIKVSRVNLIALLVSKEGNVLTLDDGTGRIQVMIFEDRLRNKIPELGKILLLIGKIREHEETRFLVPEIIKELENPKWLEYRKKELEQIKHIIKTPERKRKEKTTIKPEVIENYQEKIINKIQELDDGDGANYQDIINSVKIDKVEEKIEELIKEGEIFEIKGKLKIL